LQGLNNFTAGSVSDKLDATVISGTFPPAMTRAAGWFSYTFASRRARSSWTSGRWLYCRRRWLPLRRSLWRSNRCRKATGVLRGDSGLRALWRTRLF